ncbi:MAG TPA: hypothetical protein VLR71_21245 [Casimicrobiaceae bacterium]|nr:hypothetical protein [Casimicrobiaceae bacterium]
MSNQSARIVGRRRVRCIVAAFACAVSGPSTGATLSVVEFYNAGLQHFFISANAAEIALLDGGAFGGVWKRTGQSFPAWDVDGAPANASPVCRFFGTDQYRSDGSRIGPNSHFYTADPTECAFVKTAFQSIAGDGRSYPAWTFEANAFAVQLPAAGACPTGTQALYRSYNDGARGDPNHHYSTSASALQAMPGWTFEGLVMCLPPGPTATALGAPIGGAATATIGPAGGTISAPDGQLTLTIPAGALSAATVIGIQPISNFAHGAIGNAYRLTPDKQTFATPITLTFKYADDELPGTAATFLGAAFQTAAGYWQWFGPATVDTAAKTVSVGSTHFTDISKVKGLQIRPSHKIVKPRASVDLHVKLCYTDPGDGLILGYDCDLDQGPDGILTVDEWSVNAIPGGNAALGTVAPNNTTATYVAPANAPSPPTVAVSARAHVAQLGGSDLVVSNITIALDTWVGTATGINEFVTTVATVTWTLDSMVGNVAVYVPSGVASSTIAPIGPCASYAFDPPSHAIDIATVPPYNTEGSLTIDFNSTPPTYHGFAFTNWQARMTSSCAGPIPSIGGGPWFGGSGNPFGREASGFVAPDGVTIQGSASDTQVPPATFTWRFTRQQ